jgi:hypothetical protein
MPSLYDPYRACLAKLGASRTSANVAVLKAFVLLKLREQRLSEGRALINQLAYATALPGDDAEKIASGLRKAERARSKALQARKKTSTSPTNRISR